jgi:hypothetical protein
VLRLLIDTSTWLDLAKRRDGQRIIRPLQSLVEDESVELLVPQVVVDEFDRKRDNVEKTMTSGLTERLKGFRTELAAYGEMDYRDEELRQFDQWAHQVSLGGALTARNFDDIRSLLDTGKRLNPGSDERERVVERALAKKAPFHRQRNSVADALLAETYATAAASALPEDFCAFVTSNTADFSSVTGDQRKPHDDLAGAFTAENSTYRLGVDGLEQCLRDVFDDYFEELIAEMYFPDDARGLDEILAAEKELSDKIWYDRSMSHEQRLTDAGDYAEVERLRKVAGPGRKRVEDTYGIDDVGPYDKFEWGMLNGKLSALRWVLGDEWDFLDT